MGIFDEASNIIESSLDFVRTENWIVLLVPDINGSSTFLLTTMDVQMVDQPADKAELIVLREEDELRYIARHVKTYIPGNNDSDRIDEDAM